MDSSETACILTNDFLESRQCNLQVATSCASLQKSNIAIKYCNRQKPNWTTIEIQKGLHAVRNMNLHNHVCQCWPDFDCRKLEMA